MKNIIEILGGAQMLLGFSFDPDQVFEERLSMEHRSFLAFLRVIEEHLPRLETSYHVTGRPRYDDKAMIRAMLAKTLLQIGTNSLLRQRLISDSNLRHICGFARIPSEATFSRRLALFSQKHLPETVLARLVRDYHAGTLVRVIARDSTSIKGREKTTMKKIAPEPAVKRKRGRPRKGEIRTPPAPRRVCEQLKQSPGCPGSRYSPSFGILGS